MQQAAGPAGWGVLWSLTQLAGCPEEGLMDRSLSEELTLGERFALNLHTAL